jgi:O-antigen ligase
MRAAGRVVRDSWCWKTIRAGTCALVACNVASIGGVGFRSEFATEVGAAALVLVWSFGVFFRERDTRTISWNWIYLPFLALGGVGLAQRVFALSAYPYQTKLELLKLGAYFALAFLAVESFQSEGERKKIAWFAMLLAFCVSLFGVVQFLTWNGKIYWFWAVPNSGTSFGPFVDRDHFAGFVELASPFAFAMVIAGAVPQDAVWLATFLGILPAGALVLSASRGGLLSFSCELVLLGVLSWRRNAARSALRRAAVLILLSGVIAAWLGLGGVSRRFRELAVTGISQDRRTILLEDTWRIFREHRWVGTGLGTLQFVYPRYESRYDGATVDHAHNDYLELLAEMGVAGGICGALFIVVLFGQGLSHWRRAPSRVGVAFYSGALSACGGFLIHSFVDFNLHIPANALLFFLIAFLATSPIAGETKPRSEVVRLGESALGLWKGTAGMRREGTWRGN